MEDRQFTQAFRGPKTAVFSKLIIIIVIALAVSYTHLTLPTKRIV